MISEQEAVQLVKSAEQAKGEQKKELLLKSAQIYVQLSDVIGNKNYLNQAQELFEQAQQVKPEGQYKENELNLGSLFLKQPRFSFKDVAGLKELKETIALKIILPFKIPVVYEFFDKGVGGGVLLYGPPGCGKSLIAEATAAEADVSFFHVKASDLRSKFVGETERNIAKLFEEARKKQPCIIFFDEFEALGEERGTASAQNRGAISQLLTEMNGVGNKDQKILLLAATNEPWSIDSALKREGRFGTTIFVPPPDTEGRKQIFETLLQKVPRSEKIDYDKLAKITEGLSCADLGFIVNTAKDKAILECLKTGSLRGLSTNDLMHGLHKLKPQLRSWFSQAKQKVKQLKQQELFLDLMAWGT